jgi:hypothetical protein
VTDRKFFHRKPDRFRPDCRGQLPLLSNSRFDMIPESQTELRRTPNPPNLLSAEGTSTERIDPPTCGKIQHTPVPEPNIAAVRQSLQPF